MSEAAQNSGIAHYERVNKTARRWYVAGPMTGLPEFNYPAFHAEAERLRVLGFWVENPAENASPICGTWEGYLRQAIRQMLLCDGVVLLPGWENSRGAVLERHVAMQLGLVVVNAGELQDCCGEKFASAMTT